MGFWEAFLLLAIFIPLTILWVTCVLDLVFKRHDLSGWGRAAWIAAIIIFPAVGSIAYVAFGGMAPLSGSPGMSGPATSAREDALRHRGRTPY